MPFNAFLPPDPSYNPINDPLREDVNTTGNTAQPDIISNNPQMPYGQRVRQLIRWRVPKLGFVDMYINPQQMVITEKKIISKQRTKGGYIIQYWGEELTSIKLDGTTGAAGIEGINILRKVYRAEQDAFQLVAQQLQDRVHAYSAGGSIANLLTGGGSVSQKIGGAITGLLGGSANPPLLPSLGSLAVSVELFYQGWVFKGFFEDFTVTEAVNIGAGIFNYTTTFTVLDRRGTRSNFGTFNRLPAVLDQNGNPINYYHSDYNSTPLSFSGEKE
jgi:hypothetical protein